MTKKEIEELLRKGAYGALMDDDKAGDEFCEEDIDQILQQRTKVIQIESEGKGSTFAKVSFISVLYCFFIVVRLKIIWQCIHIEKPFFCWKITIHM